MAEDIVPGLLEKVQSDYRKLRENDEELARISERTAAGSADGKDLDAYAVREGELLAEALRRNVSGDILPNGKMYFNIANRVLPPVLKENYGNVADMSQRIITGMNERAGIHIKAQRPELNEDRVKGLVNLAATANQYDDRQKELEGDVVNFSQSVGTDTVRKNADFQYKAGLSPKIVRTAAAGCCKWCTDLAGTYDYATVKASGNEVWQRHRGCGCVVEYDPGNGSRQNVHTKQQYDWKEENAEKINNRLERTTEIAMRQTGGKVTGGHRYPIEEYDTTKDILAKKMYEVYSRVDDSETISKNTGFSVEDIRTIRSHIFFKKHDLDDGYKRFYPDYDMAVAWKRLQEGNYLPRDITLLNHELLESKLEKEYNLTAGEAHELTQKTYNWVKQLIEETGGKGEDGGILQTNIT